MNPFFLYPSRILALLLVSLASHAGAQNASHPATGNLLLDGGFEEAETNSPRP
jgi:hypothetical protein